MLMKKLGFLSDTHVGFRQYGLESRWEDFNRAFSTSLYTLISQGVKDIFLAGDIIHQARPTARTVGFLYEVHRWLADTVKARVYVIPGNHDLTQPHWLSTFQHSDDKGYGFIVADQTTIVAEGLTVYCRGFMAPDLFRAESPSFPDTDIIVSHQGMVEFTGIERSGNLTFEDFHPGKYKLAVIGDTHVTEKQVVEGTTFLSPGSTEMNAADEPVEKFVHIAHFDDANVLIQVESLPVPIRKVFNFENVRTEKDVSDLVDLVRGYFDSTEKGRATLVAHYSRECGDAVKTIMDLQRSYDIIIRLVPMPVTGKDPKTFTKAEGRSMLEIAQQEVQVPEVQELVHGVLSHLDDPGPIIDEWIDTTLKACSPA